MEAVLLFVLTQVGFLELRVTADPLVSLPTSKPVGLSSLRVSDVERPVKGPFCLVDGVVLGQGAARAGLEHRVVGWCAVAERAWWWASGWVGTTRRGVVDRQATTLMCAGWDRRSAIRRKVPLTRNAAGQTGAHNTDGDRSCDGGAPARRDD